MQLRQRPCCKPLWVDRLGNLPDVPRNLRVASQIVDELGVHNTEIPLADRAESRLRRRPCFLRAFIPRQQCLKVRASKLATSVDNQNLRKSAKAANAFAQDHHARTVARWIEGEIERQGSARERIGQQRQPGAAEHLAGTSDTLHIQLCMVHVGYLEWAIAVTWRLEVEVPIKGIQLITGAPALPFQCLIVSRPLPHPNTESLVARCGDCLSLAGKLQLYPGGILCLLFQCLVVPFDEFLHQTTRRFR